MKKLLLLPLLLFVASANSQITVSTIAGDGTPQTVDGNGALASFYNPNGIVKDSNGNIFVAEESGFVVRKITPSGDVTTFAGSGSSGNVDGTGVLAQFGRVASLAIDSSNNIYVGDYQNGSVRKISPSGVVTTLTNGLTFPYGICIDPSNTNLYVADGTSRKIFKVEIQTGTITLIAGNSAGGNTDGIGEQASFNLPFGVIVDPTNTYLYVSDFFNNNIRRITLSNAQVSLFAGSGTSSFADGNGSNASFYGPIGMAVDAGGNLFVADHFNNRIRRVNTNAGVTTVAGNDNQGSTDGTAVNASFNQPVQLFLDNNELFVSEYNGNKIRKINNINLNTNDFNDLVFSMYPNPAFDRITVEMDTEVKSIEIYSIHGQKVQTSNTKSVVLNNLAAGVYFVKVEDVSGLNSTKKLIIK